MTRITGSALAGAALAALNMLLTAGCKAPVTHFPKNVIAIEASGTLRVQEDQNGQTVLARQDTPKEAAKKQAAPEDATRLSEREKYIARTTSYLRGIFTNNPALNQSSEILIFFQGGLNNVGHGIARAEALTKPILNERTNSIYPFFVAWNANLFSAWAEQYSTHRGQNITRPRYRFLLAPLTATANIGRYVSRLPLSTIEQHYAGLRTYRAPHYGGGTDVLPYLARPEQVNKQLEQLQKEEYDARLHPSEGTGRLRPRGATMFLSAVPKSPVIAAVDTGGKLAWDHMLRRTRTMFTLAETFDPGGMELFADALAQYLRTNSNKHVTLVGHSMGAIVANELIRRHGDRLRIKNIVYLAAACGVDEFEKTIIPFLQKNCDAHFYNLSLHPANDISELAYWWTFPVVPRGSLLDWIDFYYSTADTDYGWTMGKWDNAIMGTRHFLQPPTGPQLRERIHLKAFGFGDERWHGPQKHGGFDEWTFWREDFWKPANEFNSNWRHYHLKR